MNSEYCNFMNSPLTRYTTMQSHLPIINSVATMSRCERIKNWVCMKIIMDKLFSNLSDGPKMFIGCFVRITCLTLTVGGIALNAYLLFPKMYAPAIGDLRDSNSYKLKYIVATTLVNLIIMVVHEIASHFTQLGVSRRIDIVETIVTNTSKDVKDLKANVTKIEIDVKNLKANVKELKEDVAELKVDVEHLKEDVAELKVDVAELKVDVAELKVDVAKLKVDVAELKEDVKELKTDMAKVKVEVKELKEDVTEIKVDIKRIFSILNEMHPAYVNDYKPLYDIPLKSKPVKWPRRVSDQINTLDEYTEIQQKCVFGPSGNHERQIEQVNDEFEKFYDNFIASTCGLRKRK